MTIRVLLIDDSAVARRMIPEALASAADVQVIGTAATPNIALEKMKGEWPDVIVIDAHLPRSENLNFIRKLMHDHPTPVIVCSALDEKNAHVTLDAMAAGAVSVVPKHFDHGHLLIDELRQHLLHDIRSAVRTHLAQMNRRVVAGLSQAQANHSSNQTATGGDRTAAVLAHAMHERQSAPRLNADAILPPPKPQAAQSIMKTAQQIVVIGISTGGTQALEKMLPMLPTTCPGMAIVQHMPETLTGAFAKRLNDLSKIDIKEAADGDQILQGRALISPGGKHLLVRRSGIHYFVEVREGPLVNRHRPSVDVLFRSAASAAGINATGVIMTGMGDDGAHGMKEMFDCGAHTIAQDEASCTVFGMPKEAIRLGGVKETLSLLQIAQKIGGKT